MSAFDPQPASILNPFHATGAAVSDADQRPDRAYRGSWAAPSGHSRRDTG